MSGSGKSHWSKQLEMKGFKRFCCDDLIESRLGKELMALGFCGINDVSKWMGQPYEKRYQRASQKYIRIEKAVMSEILCNIKKFNDNADVVIDTTGSVIYCGHSINKQLKILSKVIYLDTPLQYQAKMYQLYLQDPKPVIWGKIFKKSMNDTNFSALKKCYPRLIEYRSKKYEQYADRKLDYEMLHDPKFSADLFLKEIV